jgi:phenylacetic acid degradation operon negative regulatory protein
MPSAAGAARRAESPAPAFRRRREVGAASARSLLLTVLGEFVRPAGEPVWTAAFLSCLDLVGVDEKATRQALARTAAEGWIEPRRDGRRTAWALTAAGRELLTEGAERIYGFGSAGTEWAGAWLLVTVSAPESDRRTRHLLRSRLTWYGLGNLLPGVWISAHPERQAEVRRVLAQIGLDAAATFFVARLGELGDPRRIADTAWDLSDVEERYEEFITGVRRLRPRTDESALAAQVRLVQEWRRFPFVDPGLPAELLPPRWSGARAAALFRDRHAAWQPAARAAWRELAGS